MRLVVPSILSRIIDFSSGSVWVPFQVCFYFRKTLRILSIIQTYLRSSLDCVMKVNSVYYSMLHILAVFVTVRYLTLVVI